MLQFLLSKGECLSSSIKRAILEVVVSGVAASPEDVSLYAACTLLAASVAEGEGQTSSLILQCVQFLQENEFISVQKVTSKQGMWIQGYHWTREQYVLPLEKYGLNFRTMQFTGQIYHLINGLHCFSLNLNKVPVLTYEV